MKSLLEVARRPSSNRARASSAAPVHTEVTISASAARRRNHSNRDYRFVDLAPRADPAGHQDNVDPWTIGERVISYRSRPLRAFDRAGLLGGHNDRACAGDLGIHSPSLQRAEHVEQFEALEEQHADSFCVTPSNPPYRAVGATSL